MYPNSLIQSVTEMKTSIVSCVPFLSQVFEIRGSPSRVAPATSLAPGAMGGLCHRTGPRWPRSKLLRGHLDLRLKKICLLRSDRALGEEGGPFFSIFLPFMLF